VYRFVCIEQITFTKFEQALFPAMASGTIECAATGDFALLDVIGNAAIGAYELLGNAVALH
jgi:hypothetical protein